MKTKKLQDIRDLIKSDELAAWYDLYRGLRAQIEAAHAAYADVEHTVYRAGELDDESAHAHAEYVTLEESFEALSEYEVQRQRTTAAWVEISRSEKELEDMRADAAELRTRIEARAKGRRSTSTVETAVRREEDLGKLDAEIERRAKQLDDMRRGFEQASGLRDRLWEEVEGEWSQAFRWNMARAEYAYMARRVRAQAGAGAAHTPSGATDSELDGRLEALEAKLEEVLQQARTTFACVAIREFLYWPHEDDVLGALCVPLIDESVHLNVEVKALHPYEIERAKGIEFIEPVPREAETADDPRLAAFFAASAASAAGA